MDYSHLLSPAAIVAIIVACGSIAAQIIADARRAVASRRLYSQLFAQMRRQQAKPVTIVIELRRAAESILPLLDHLQQQKYAKLTVIVMIRQTAGSRAQAKLASYRRTAGYGQLRLVKHRKGMTMVSVVRRYAPRGLVLQLNANDRVGDDFFYQTSFHFADAQVAAVVPRAQIAMNTTLGSALQATVALWDDFKRSIVRQPAISDTFQPGTVYRTTSLLSSKQVALPAVYSQTAYLRHSPQPQMVATMTRVVASLGPTTAWLTAVLVACVAYSCMTADGTPGFFLLVVYCALLAVRLAATKGYSLLEKLTIMLFAPFSVLIFVGVAVFGLVLGVYRHVFFVTRATKKAPKVKKVSSAA